MAKVIVIYEEPKDKEGFEKHYFDVHIPLAKKLPTLKNAAINRVLHGENTDQNMYLVAELEFEDVDTLNQSLSSAEGQEVQGDVANLVPFLNKPPIILIAE
ncbi:EthD family reductase [Effusibacillus dendaii]|uniref:EthD domain-containing protein n=1 Tax=Effusibacillus dendaii TaxID=2743772 RepID=A0A7I8DE98_9BACL|nr:EthD family reductase [Effusibacillus dendaii]BCJ88367.1 hypothetical protein skT53_33520 [Effusibacillus dendaii]